ncbi:MAG TPA: hypothetical protein VFB63_04845, partial [Bryobacteraceae bacterium]|nr:hypothetical protein [Bryobacteraceae bacterium]
YEELSPFHHGSNQFTPATGSSAHSTQLLKVFYADPQLAEDGVKQRWADFADTRGSGRRV